eukprot:902132-Amphidinium_carterae.1
MAQVVAIGERLEWCIGAEMVAVAAAMRTRPTITLPAITKWNSADECVRDLAFPLAFHSILPLAEHAVAQHTPNPADD